MSAPRHIDYATSGSVAVLTITRPEKRNAIALQTIDELREAITRAEKEPDVRSIVLTGAGDRVFASGADLDEIPGAMDTPQNAVEYDRRVGALYNTCQASPLPIVARIQGHAIGGGCLLALACDIRVAREHIELGLPVSRIGLMLSPEEHYLLVNQVGPSRTKLLLFTGRRLTAHQAAAWGLVDVVAEDNKLDDTVNELVQEIASGAPLAIKAAKRLVNAAHRDGQASETAEACYREIYTSDDLREGLAAMRERRAPVFRGR